jgi:hypothetical protein
LDYALLIAQIIVADATLVLAYMAWRNIRLTARLAKDQERPRLVLNTKPVTLTRFEFQIINIGRFPAHDVAIEAINPANGRRILTGSRMYMPPGDVLGIPCEHIGPANIKLDYESSFEIPYSDEFTYIINPVRQNGD